jgi:hypothetical protein
MPEIDPQGRGNADLCREIGLFGRERQNSIHHLLFVTAYYFFPPNIHCNP